MEIVSGPLRHERVDHCYPISFDGICDGKHPFRERCLAYGYRPKICSVKEPSDGRVGRLAGS